MDGWHHGLDGCESEWTLGDGDGQGGLGCCNSWGGKELDMTERLNWTELNWTQSRLLLKVLREALTCSRDVRCLVLGTEYIYCSSSSFVLTVNNCDHNISFELRLECQKGVSYIENQRLKCFWKQEVQFSSVQLSCSVVSDSLWPHEPQHTRPPCPSPTPGVHPNSCPSSQWCHPAISFSVVPFSSCPPCQIFKPNNWQLLLNAYYVLSSLKQYF